MVSLWGDLGFRVPGIKDLGLGVWGIEGLGLGVWGLDLQVVFKVGQSLGTLAYARSPTP